MEDRYLYRGKRTLTDDMWVYWDGFIGVQPNTVIKEETICQCTGLKDKNGKLIWENDILMCHDNPNDLVKVVFGKFTVINAETLENIDEVIGWHYEVIPTDDISRCEPFCLSMPITEDYVKTCEFEVIGNMIDNQELLGV